MGTVFGSLFRVLPLTLGVACAFPVYAANTWSIVDIDPGNTVSNNSGVYTYANALNDSGQVVGYRFEKFNSNTLQLAFLTGADGAGISSIGALGTIKSIAYGVNNLGQVVGSYSSVVDYAFATGANGQGMYSLFGKVNSIAYDINDAGQIVGQYKTAAGANTKNAFVIRSGSVTNLDSTPNATLNSDSVAFAINGSGSVVGVEPGAALGYTRSMVAGPSETVFSPLGIDGVNQGGAYNQAVDINDHGLVVGWYGLFHNGYIYDSQTKTFTQLGTLTNTLHSQSEAYGINNSGTVVGKSQAANGQWHAFVWGVNGGGMVDLNTLVDLPAGVYLQEARDINNHGQIIANASNGRAYLISAVPEPSTWALGLVGLGVIGLVRRRRNDAAH